MRYFELPADFDVQERGRRARENFRKGYNCAQSVALAFADVLPVDEQTIKTALSGFGGGMARLRELCGCVSGMAFVAGFMLPAVHPEVMEERKANYALVQKLAGAFRDDFGSLVCRDLLELRKNAKIESPAPSERTPEYYAKRPCERQIGRAAEIVATELMAEQA